MIFPKTLAQGDAFCNRDAERQRLKSNIKNIQHTLVVSPRRYGKTSLILKTIEEIKWPYTHIDLFLAVDEAIISERFVDGIAKLITQIIPINMKAIAKIREFFKSFTVSLTAGEVSLGLKLESTHKSYSATIKNAIENLEALLMKYNKHAVFFIDEMQDIVHTPLCSQVEAILRFYAQKTKNLAFIFSGSNRKLLKEIFDDRARPLFKMCDRINLQRISKEHWESFLNKAAIKKWKRVLPEASLNVIFHMTELHSYYVNYLCSRLWQLSDLPTIRQINDIWQQMCAEETSSIALEIDSLSINQKKLLRYISQKGALTKPAALEHQHALHLTSRGILQSIKGLIAKDIVEMINEKIRITDPLMKTILLF